MGQSYEDAFVSSLLTVLFFVFLITFTGLALGSISIKRVSLGHGGVLVMSIITGAIFKIKANKRDVTEFTADKLVICLWNDSIKSKYSLISSLGTDLFVPAIGLISGPKFFRGFNKNTVGYVLMGLIATIIDVLITILISYLDKNMDISLGVGIFTGALTTTPGYSSGLEAAQTVSSECADQVTAGYGIAYIFGILGVVLFVQIIPKILNVDIAKEKEEFIAANTVEVPKYEGTLFSLDKSGLFSFCLVTFLGLCFGSIKIPISNASYFSFGSSGGTLIVGLIIGHFGHIGPLNLEVPKPTLNFMRELGLTFFLIGSGVPGGVNFVKYVKGLYFVYGMILTLVPMILCFLFGKFVFKLSIFNNLGSICGSMTSTPALGSLIALTGTDEVSSAYAASYPVASVICVVSANLMVLLGN